MLSDAPSTTPPYPVERLRAELAARVDEVPDYRAGDVHRERALMHDSMGSSAARPAHVWSTAPTGTGPTGDSPLELRVHLPAGAPPRSALMHIHGGGFFMGSAALYDGVCQGIADDTGSAVISIDYRLAPEHPYPAGLDDCETAWSVVVSRIDELGVPSGSVGLYGESAGAALAIGLMSRIHARRGVLPAYLVAQEPVIDDRLESGSSRLYTGTPVWNRGLAEWSWSIYLSQGYEGGATHEVSPARLPTVGWFPPTFISTRDLDPLRDEGLAFAIRLIDEGVAVDLRHYAGTFHGCVGLEGTAIAARIARDAAEFVRDRNGER